MNTIEAIKNRKSVRAYTNKPVEKDTILKILEAARFAPSGTNTQPWQVFVLTGKTKKHIQEKLETAFRTGAEKNPDYKYYPDEWISPYNDRRKATGLALYKSLEIKREDSQKKIDQWAKNYRSFDAPVMIFFFMDPVMNQGSYLDYGMFLQNFMLAALEEGLGTCAQGALGEYPDIVKSELGIAKEKILICGMALGYEDTDDPVNGFRTEREEVESFTAFFD